MRRTESSRGKHYSYSKQQIRQQMAAVENLLVQGHPTSHIVVAVSEQIGIKKARVRRLIDRVYKRFAEEDAAARPAWKSQQIRRLTRMIRVSMGEKNEAGQWIVEPDLTAYRQLEALLADVQGTREALQLNIDIEMKSAVTACFASMTAEQLEELYERGAENQRLAEQARAMLLPANVSRETLNGEGFDAE